MENNNSQLIAKMSKHITELEAKIKEQDLIIYGITEGAEELKAKCSDQQWKLDQQATHTKQLCVGFAEWQKQEEKAEHIDWWNTEDKWVVNSHAPYFVDSKEVDANWITHSDLYEHYLKYLKEKEQIKTTNNELDSSKG